MNIHCVGNSHLNNFSKTDGFVNFQWSNSEIFKFNYLGPVIAYNFYEHHFPKFKSDYLPKINKEEDYIIFVVGEVDCRLHLPKQADEQNKSDEDIVAECINRFERIYDELKDYKIIIFGTHPTTTEDHDMSNSGRPIYGNCQRRNNICILWNKKLKEIAEKRNYPYLSIYDELVDENNITKMDYFFDYCHLNSMKIWNVLEKEFNKLGVKI